MNDWELVEAAFDLIESAEVIQEFDHHLWVKVDRELWEQLVGAGHDQG